MKPRILVIDDEDGIRFTLEAFLSDEGYEVTTASNYDEAISCINTSAFDLIFADIILLDGKTGMDVLKEIKQRGLPCLFVVITGIPEVKTASEAVRLGAFDYIAKPVVYETLVHTARVALQHKAVIDEKERCRKNVEAVFKSVRDAIIAVDSTLTVIEINEAAAGICSLSRDVMGKPFNTLFTQCSGRCLEAVLETIETNQPTEICRFECGHTLRPRQIATAVTHPILNGNGVVGAVLVIRDETRLVALERETEERRKYHSTIGKSEKMQKIYTLIEDIASVQTTVLITGESGTGKELVAEALHYRGERRKKPFVKVNCSALPESLLESELFGHVRGSFTGAVKDRNGRFQEADGGTIFLDEIGDISQEIQRLLLRVLQEKEFECVGSSTTTKVDVRVITATNQDLEERIKTGKFREDLYYRLNVIEINLPPLRERREDIPLLVSHFLDKFNKILKKSITGISANVQRLFMEYSWQGNIRELEHAVEYACILCRGTLITMDHLPVEMGKYAESKTAIDGDERLTILQALEASSWNVAKAARILGIGRRTIYRKIGLYQLRPPEQ